MRQNLPMDLLRTFVTIVDTGSMVRASEHVFLTQSALSLQMKRLADIIQQPIFGRHQGAMLLTPAGEELLIDAREVLALNDKIISKMCGRLTVPIRIGMVQDFADAILSGVLARFKQMNPDIQLEVRVTNSVELAELVDSELLDIALYFGDAHDEASIAVADIGWIGERGLLALPTLPVALMTKPCLFRDVAVASLEQASHPYRVMMDTSSISVLRAAVESGLAVTCRCNTLLGHGFQPLELGDEPLGKISFNLNVRSSPHPTIENLAALIRDVVEQIGC